MINDQSVWLINYYSLPNPFQNVQICWINKPLVNLYSRLKEIKNIELGLSKWLDRIVFFFVCFIMINFYRKSCPSILENPGNGYRTDILIAAYVGFDSFYRRKNCWTKKWDKQLFLMVILIRCNVVRLC